MSVTNTAMSGTVPVNYSERWDEGQPVTPLDERTARLRHDGAPGYYTAVLGDPPQVLIEVNWDEDYLGVYYLDAQLRREKKHSFTRHDGRLFLDEVRLWQYAGENDPNYRSPVYVKWKFTRDGGLRIITTNRVLKERTIESAKGPVDVTANWEDIPAFGDWASVTRPERDVSLAEQPQWHRQLFGT